MLADFLPFPSTPFSPNPNPSLTNDLQWPHAVRDIESYHELHDGGAHGFRILVGGGNAGNKFKISLGLPVGAILNCADNSGAKSLFIIQPFGKGARLNRLPSASVGDMVVASVKKGKPELRKKGIPLFGLACKTLAKRVGLGYSYAGCCCETTEIMAAARRRFPLFRGMSVDLQIALWFSSTNASCSTG